MKDARVAAEQIVWFVGAVSIVIMVIVYLFKAFILNTLFGQISDEVRGHANTMEKNGFIIVDPGEDLSEVLAKEESRVAKANKGAVSVASVSENVVLIRPSVAWDTETGAWRIGGGFAWKSDTSSVKYWAKDKAWWCCDLMYKSDDIGAVDQFGLYFTNTDVSNVVNVGSHRLTLWNANDSKTTTLTTPSDSTRQGVSFTGQDTIRYEGATFPNGGLDYNWDDVVISTYFRITAVGATYEIKPQFDHTWSDSSLTGVAVQPWEISLSWGSNPSSFRATSDAPTYWTP